MKQIAQNYRSGRIAVIDVPVPPCKPGGVLVRTAYSLVSTGTELMKVHESKLSLVGKARARPDQVKRVAQSIAQQGVLSTYRKVMSSLDSLNPLGYSLAGTVVEAGNDVRDFVVGERVACGGNLYSLHAEYNWVPRNLCVAVPPSVKSEHAAFTTVGAIAMHGFRQAEARLGEISCVIGLGLVGQILVQILRAAGVHVFGIDVLEDRSRLAEQMGANAAAVPHTPSFDSMLKRIAILTRGAGADHIFIAAGSPTNEPVELATKLARDRARIIDIGKCKLDLPWKEFYEKEFDVRFSRSYGPGRYDPRYEEDGIDYPIGYVRWTERRNMECFIDLLAGGRLDMAPLVGEVLPFEEAAGVYERMSAGQHQGLGVLFQYATDIQREHSRAVDSNVDAPVPRRISLPGKVRIGVIGCGNYAKSMILPHLASRSDVSLVEVVTTRSLSAADAQAKFGFERASTDVSRLLASEDVDAVLIMTRHASHAPILSQALRAEKAVFVEKPLAVDQLQLVSICEAVRDTGNARIMVGFNRRFSRLLNDLRTAWGPRGGPCNINYIVNAGQLEPNSWYAQAQTEGARFVGEGCHFVDTVSWWLGCDPCEVSAVRSGDDPDNVVVTLFYPEGSVAHVSYLTQGDSRYPKEIIEVFGDSKVAKFSHFTRTELWRAGRCRVRRSLGGIDKGQRRELDVFIEAVKRGDPMPITFKSLVATTATTLAAICSAAKRRTESVDAWCSSLETPDAGA